MLLITAFLKEKTQRKKDVKQLARSCLFIKICFITRRALSQIPPLFLAAASRIITRPGRLYVSFFLFFSLSGFVTWSVLNPLAGMPRSSFFLLMSRASFRDRKEWKGKKEKKRNQVQVEQLPSSPVSSFSPFLPHHPSFGFFLFRFCFFH